MSMGIFSLSLAVKNLAASREFYETLGFEVFAGDEDKNYLILTNGDCTLGLFQGMFEKNILTFNPGWGPRAQPLDEFEDVRDIQKRLREKSVEFHNEADESTTGPESFIISDPDGNPILVDQHV